MPRFPALPGPLRRLLPASGGDTLRAAVELGLVLVLAWQAARLVWLFAVPSGPVGGWADAAPPAAPAPPLVIASDPFHPGARPAPATSSAAGLRLHGVRADGTAGSAILSAGDGAQAPFRVGDEVAPGVELAAVGPGHAVLRTRTGAQRLELASPAAPTGARTATRSLPAAAAAAPAANAPVDPAALLAEAGLRPRTEGGRITGYTVIPRGGGRLLRESGLQSGDVLVAVDGNPLNPERLAELESELARRDEVRLTVERGGRAQTLTLRTTSP